MTDSAESGLLRRGKTRLPASLRAMHALLAIDVAHAHTRYVVRTLADLHCINLVSHDG
jgi:hypothetical protein